MKSLITIVALSIASTSAMANVECQTTPVRGGAFLSIELSDITPYTATLSGVQSGGMAHFMRKIGPFNVKISHEVELSMYSNSEEGIELTLVAAPLAGLLPSASFKEGNIPAVQMSCRNVK